MIEQARRAVEEGIAFVKRSGLKLDALERGYVRCSMPLAGNENHIGTMYAGALYTLAEIPGGALFLSSFDISRYFPIIREHRIQYLAPARGDIYVEVRIEDAEIARIQGEADEKGKADYTLVADLTDADGKVVARAEGIYQLRRV